MIEFTDTIQINRNIKDVFGFISDINQLLEWNYGIDRVEHMGNEYHLYRNQGVQTFEKIIVTELRPDNLIVLSAIGDRFSYTMFYELKAINEYSTELVNYGEIVPDSDKDIMFKIMRSKVKNEVSQNLEGLKKLLDGSN